MSVLVIVILVLFNSFAQIFLKMGALRTKEKNLLSSINIYIILGYILFFSATLLSVYLLKLINFKDLTVIISLNYVSTLILSNVILKEKYSKQKVYATLLIIVGVIIFNI
ncbi:EamA family transporter [Paenibacillus sp. NPDC058174]|uniref:EamA family transporter n=1 Tax=Paenibacillus sp. NPDC058174 TaxID=3346366 RepID=UPI0036DAB4C8